MEETPATTVAAWPFRATNGIDIENKALASA